MGPVIDIVKSVLGHRQFLLRGLENAKGELNLVALAWSLKRMFVLTGWFSTAMTISEYLERYFIKILPSLSVNIGELLFALTVIATRCENT